MTDDTAGGRLLGAALQPGEAPASGPGAPAPSADRAGLVAVGPGRGPLEGAPDVGGGPVPALAADGDRPAEVAQPGETAPPPEFEAEMVPPEEGAPLPDIPPYGDPAPRSESERTAGAGVAPDPVTSVATGSAAPPLAEPAARTEARLAHLHLQVRMLALARAELETLAALDALDVTALSDLAEVRWRTGDLVGAGQAAEAHLQAGGEELVAMCVAAEAATAMGRTADARDLAARVLARGREQLDELFAGQTRSAVWPPDVVSPGPLAAPPLTAGDGASTMKPVGPSAEPVVSGDLADVQARMARGEMAGTGTRLALVLRARPALAPAVLAVADEALPLAASGPEVASLHLARGDAYRLMGRETQAAEAFWQSSKALHGAINPEETQ